MTDWRSAWIKLILVLIFNSDVVNGDVFTSMNEVENVLLAEEDVVNAVTKYIQRQERKLEGLRRFSKDCHANQKKFQAEPIKASDSLNTYLITKRLEEFGVLKNFIKRNEADAFLKNITTHRKYSGIIGGFPQEQDFIGAAQALFRLQDTYKLSTKTIANGEIPGIQSPVETLSAFECFELGRVAYLQHPVDYYHTLLWMQEALDRLKSEIHPTVKETDVLEHLAYAMYHQENVERATLLARRWKQLKPNDSRVDDNLEFYELELMAIHKDPKTISEHTLPPLNLIRPPPQNLVENFDVYEKLCRGEMKMSESHRAKLNCHYKRDRPFLKLAPLKSEMIYLRPRIIIYRQAVSEIESAIIKELAGPYLARALIENSQGKQETATYRISKSAWLKDRTDPVVKRVSRRVEDMTDLSVASAEDLQVANYGLGGHYEPHFDFAERDEEDAFKDLGTGNRIATVMFYLSQPLSGGSTVFPELNLTIRPSENDAILWYNLHKNGEGNTLLRHAACPVVAGNKWVANKWLHEVGQELLRPCGLEDDDEEWE